MQPAYVLLIAQYQQSVKSTEPNYFIKDTS